MFHFSAFMASVGMFFSGIFGGGHASTTAMMHSPSDRGQWEASTTAMHGDMPMMRNGVFGVVTVIDGTIITVDGRQGTSTASTTYSVDASNAKVIKGPATSTASISDISVGDHVIVEGAVTGTSIVATTVIDGVFAPGGMGRGMMGSTTVGMWRDGASTTPGMRHPTPGTPPGGPQGRIPGGMNPGGPMQGMPGMGGQNGGSNQQ